MQRGQGAKEHTGIKKGSENEERATRRARTSAGLRSKNRWKRFLRWKKTKCLMVEALCRIQLILTQLLALALTS